MLISRRYVYLLCEVLHSPYTLLDLSRDLQRIHRLPREPVLTGNSGRARLHLPADLQR